MNEENEGLILATASVQSQEKLHHYLKQHKTVQPCKKLVNESASVLDHLKTIRSQLEGTDVDFEATQVSEKTLQKLRQLVLMHTPSSVTEQIQSQFRQHFDALLTGGVKKIVFAALVTCPWYCSTQTDRGLQAKHNTLLVLYMHTDTQVISPINYHVREQSEVIDHDWFYAAEIYHYANYLVKGKCRFMELLFSPDGMVLYQSEEWRLLHDIVDRQAVAGVRGMLEQCRGQAVGAVGKKSQKTGCMRLREGATLYEFCESFRLLNHAWNILNELPLDLTVTSPEKLPTVGQNALEKINAIYGEENTVTKADLFEIVLSWKKEIDELMKTFKFTKAERAEEMVGSWLYKVRTAEKLPLDPSDIGTADTDKLKSLLQNIGGVVAEMSPQNIIMIARAGSYIYNLATPQSDVDYIIVYKEPTEVVLGSCKRLVECKEHRGPELSLEYGAYEVKTFCEMLLKGSVVTTELVFVGEVDYASNKWKELVTHRDKFVTEKLIVQYFGLIRNNMLDIENKRHARSPRERKLFYQVFHKLNTLDDLIQGMVPPIRCTGTRREFIMKIRMGPLEGEISRENLFQLAKNRIEEQKKILINRKDRLPENVNFKFLRDWITSVRGWPS